MTVLATVLLASIGQASAAEKPKLPRCDGGKRRDANPYGSVLPGAPKPAITAPATARKPVAARTVPSRQAAVARQRAYPSC